VATNHNFRVKNGLEVAGTEIVNSSGVIQLASTLTSSTQSAGTNNTTLATTAFVTAAVAAIGDGHIDWTGSSAGTIHSSNYTNTTYSVGDGGLTTNDFTNADHSKLNAIEASATADQTNAEIRAAVEAATDSNAFTDADHTKLNAVEASADVTDTANVVAALTAGTNVTIAANGTIASTDTNTTYSVGDGGLTTNDFTDADHTKLNAIEASATADQTDAEIRTAVEAATNSNVFTDADHSKLNAIEASATTDQTDAEIRAAVEAATDSNVFTNADHTKLNAIEASADVTDTTNVVAALTAGTNVTIAANGTIASTDTNTTYSVGDGGLTTNDFTNADHSKLNAIEASATADQTNAEIRTAVEAATDSNVFTDADHTKLNAVEASADVTDTANVVAALTAGTNVTISAGGTIASTDTNTTYSVGDGGLTTNDFTNADHSKLNAIEASADVTDTANVVAALSAGTGVAISGAGAISVTAVALTTVQTASSQSAHLALTAEEGDIVVRSDENKTYCHNGGSAGNMNDYTLLATPTDAVLSVNGNTGAVSAAQIAAAVEAASNSNTFTDADHSKLNAIEASATADQTNAEIRAAIEAATDSNAFTDADHSKLNAIEASATADQTGAQIKALYEAESNAYTDTKNSKLAGIEASATADQSNAEIRAAVEAATDSNVFTDADHTKLNAIEASADVTDTTNVVAALTAGTNVTIAANGTIASTDTNTTYSVGDGGLTTNDFTNADHSKLNAIEASADVTDTTNVVAALTAGTNVTIAANGTIASTDTNTTYSVGDGGLSQNNFTNADHSKLNAIEASATADQTNAEIRTAVEAATDSNVFTDADHSKLNAIEASATADQTNAEIRAAIEAATDSNAFTDADHTKLNAIEASADVTDTANVTSAGALMDSELTSIASVKALNQALATGNSPTFAALTITGAITSAAKNVGTQTVTATAPSSASGFPNGHVWYVV
jgi:hypothetical protein